MRPSPDEPSPARPMGLKIEHLYQGQVVIFTLSDMRRETVDAWIGACLAEMHACAEAGRPIRVVQDLSHPNAIHTPYSQKRGGEVTEAYPELGGYVAFVLESSVEASRTQMFLRSQPHKYRVRDAFFSREEAITWLLQQPDAPPTQPG